MKREHNIITETPLPTGYRQLEYIECTGTQYIDTGVYVSSDLKWYIEIQWLQFNQHNAFGCERWTSPGNIMRLIYSNGGSPSYVYGNIFPSNYMQKIFRCKHFR